MLEEIDLGIDYKAIGNRLRETRIRKNIKQEEVADLFDTTQSFISKIETGYSKPSLSTLIKLCKIYEVSFDYIIFDNLDHIKQSLNPDFDEIYNRLNKKIIFDGRNIYNKKLSKYGFTLYQIGC